MHGSFILFTKRELNIPALLSTSLGITNFSGVIISKIALIGTKSADARSTSTRGVYAGGACIRGFCTKNTFARGTCIVGTFIGNTCAGSAYEESAYVGVRNLMS